MESDKCAVMIMERYGGLSFFSALLFLCLTSCNVSKSYNPNKRYSQQQLRSDYSLLRKILEEKHPSLYWYTPKDSMDYFFEEGFRNIKDSMTEHAFGWKVLAPLLVHIHCGHTSMIMSKGWQRALRNKQLPSFPLYAKVWGDSMMVVKNINGDSLVGAGDFITAVNHVPVAQIIDSLFQFIPTDGYSDNLKYIRLSMALPFYFRSVFGLQSFYKLSYSDSLGVHREATIKNWFPKKDTLAHKEPAKHYRPSGKEIRQSIRSVSIDSSVAVMDLNAFSKGRLKPFFRQRFKEFEKKNVQNLIIDLRINGGGDIDKAVKLARYIRSTDFRVADTAYSVAKNFNPYAKYISGSFWNNLGLIFFSARKADGKYHFGYWERHTFRPQRKNHFDGKVYILTNGLTFSAASLFCSLVKGQENVTLVGEETGGGWYGNSGILIPNITLPETKLRVRLPFFRLVQYQHDKMTKGSGVLPDWYIGPEWHDILQGRDTKMEAVMRRIKGAASRPDID